MRSDYDVVVVGGGPGGSTLSTLVALQGHRVLLLEKEQFPRHQIGESLLPSTVHGICRLLGVADEVADAGFVKKHGGTFRWGLNAEPWSFDFSVSEKFSGPTSYAYQVERMKFDKILLDNARSKGVDVRERCDAVDVLEEDGRIRGVRYDDADGVRREVRAEFVADASGNRSRIHKRIGGARRYSEFFQNIAVFGYFTGGKRAPAPGSGNITCASFDLGWFWYIPLSDELTSVGAVLRRESAERLKDGPRAKVLEGLIGECPLIAGFLADAERVTEGPYGEVRIRKDYSYIQERFWRPGMALVGDAACFIDPLFSSGVHLSTYSALLAARSINTALSGAIAEADCFREYETRYRREYEVFHDFLVAFYDMQRDEHAYFREAKNITGSSATDTESFVELVGGGASDESALISTAPSSSRKRRADLLERSRKIHWQGSRVQVQAIFGESMGDDALYEGGLVESPDGMHWARPGQPAS
ncbi:NAD(P)/FAD-dependent oxidoreductase [Streptomyces tremellae]|uniref:NAD(P)/FAD-dependent oxidoreductase n=1 Tax=Streptomyces tremellae TaxID=1124239 RepID=A0ABP7GDG0_9ACTN